MDDVLHQRSLNQARELLRAGDEKAISEMLRDAREEVRLAAGEAVYEARIDAERLDR